MSYCMMCGHGKVWHYPNCKSRWVGESVDIPCNCHTFKDKQEDKRCKSCGCKIIFDKDWKTRNGKWIPLGYVSHKPQANDNLKISY